MRWWNWLRCRLGWHDIALWIDYEHCRRCRKRWPLHSGLLGRRGAPYPDDWTSPADAALLGSLRGSQAKALARFDRCWDELRARCTDQRTEN